MSVRGLRGEAIAKHGKAAHGFFLCRFVLQYIPVLGQETVFETDNVRCNPGRGHNEDTIAVTVRASKRPKGPPIAVIFYKLLLACALTRHSREVLGIYGYRKEGAVTVFRRNAGA
jgi:hypothetical protein